MSEPTGCGLALPTCTPCPVSPYCANCDLLVGLDGLHVIAVDRDVGLTVTVESGPGVAAGCPSCSVAGESKGRRTVRLHDIPSFGAPSVVLWRKRRFLCNEAGCEVVTFTEQDEYIAKPRALLTARATWWAVRQLRREHATVEGIARQMGVDWHTVWDAVRPLLATRADDESRFEGVTTLGVDEHVWHHVSRKKRGPREQTGMMDLTRDQHGYTRARLLDLVPGRSGTVYNKWLDDRGETFRKRVKIATLDPFQGYKNAIDDQLADAEVVLDRFHVVALGGRMLDEVRRRVQQQVHGHRGRKGDPLFTIRNLLLADPATLSDRQLNRITRALASDEAYEEVFVAWEIYHRLRAVYNHPNPKSGRDLARRWLHALRDCPIREAHRLGTTLRRWRQAFLAFFTTRGANNGGAEAINGLIELARRIARGFTNEDNYRLRMLLIAGGLD